jgi:hypothetical protein
MRQWTLLFFYEGPMIKFEDEYADTFLHVEDLNPEAHIRFRLSPLELFTFGLKCIWRSMIR